MEINFRPKPVVPTVETPLVQRTIKRTLNIHHSWPFVIWSGPAGNGKTETARHLVRELDAAYLRDPEHGFRARHFEVSSDPGGPTAGKRFLRMVHHRVIGRLTDGEARALSADDLAAQIAEGCEQRGVQVLLIDEAGLLTIHAFRALCLLRSEAESRGWPLSMVLIGMDELPRTVKKSPQVRRRVHEWCYFEPYSFEDTWDFVAAIHPHFAVLDRANAVHAEQVAYLHQELGALPGNIVPFLQKVDAALASGLRPSIDMILLRAARELTNRDEDRATKDYKHGWVPQPGPDGTGDTEDRGDAPGAAGSGRPNKKPNGPRGSKGPKVRSGALQPAHA